MPFDVRCSRYERDIVQINDLPSRLACHVLLGIVWRDDLPSAAVRILAERESAHQPQRVFLRTNPPILWDCRKHCQLVHRPKDFTERHCCSNGASNTHQKRSASLKRRSS